MFFYEKDNFLTFREYLLSESIRPIATNYGTDIDNNFSNNEWLIKGDNIYTFTEINNHFYCILLKNISDDMYEIAFATSEFKTDDPKDYTVDRHKTQKILYVFGSLLYIFLEGIKQNKHINYIVFEAANAALGKAYDKIVKNKWLLDSLKDIGFEYEGILGDYYTFKKSNK